MKPIAWGLLPLIAVASLAHSASVTVRVGGGDIEHELRLNVAEEVQ